MLTASATSPLRAEGLKEYVDCLEFADRWYEAAMEDASFVEAMAIKVVRGLMHVACTGELVS